MKTYPEKLQENKSNAAHKSSGKSKRSVPAFQPSSVLQPKFNEAGKSYPAVVQRYIDLEDNSKLSHGKQLLWADTQTVYAGKTQFEEANSIVNGSIEFIEGAQHSDFKNLYRVKAATKIGSQLEHDTSVENYNEQADEEEIQRMAYRGFEAKIIENLMELNEDALNEIEEKEDEKARFKREDELENIAKENATEQYGESLIAIRLNAYLNANHELMHRPLTPSDCQSMSRYVAGFKASDGIETDEIAAGNIYEIMPGENPAEWSWHYATIIMTDGPDHVTMENAGAKKSEEFAKKTYDRTWAFKMYGPGQGQSFDDEFAGPMGYDV